MRVPGYCIECHRPRTVRVSGNGLAMMGVTGVACGICDECSAPKPRTRSACGLLDCHCSESGLAPRSVR